MIDPEVDIPDGEFRSPEELIEKLQEVLHLLTAVWVSAADSDDPQKLAPLLLEASKVRKSIAEVYARIETAFVTCAGEKKVETPAGLFEIKQSTKRTAWEHDDLRKAVLAAAEFEGLDPLAVYVECAAPSWRVTALRDHGIQVDEYCKEEPQGWSVRLPARQLEETF